MLFKTALIGTQYASLHPELRRILGELEKQLEEWDLPKPVLTEAFRSVLEQEEIYWRSFVGVPEAEARMKARRKFSWHLCGCAADLRVGDAHRALAWLQGKYPGPELERVVHDVGYGMHLHIGYRDFGWRKKYEHPDAA